MYLGIADVSIFGGLSGGDAAVNILPGVAGRKGSQPPGDKHASCACLWWRALPSVDPGHPVQRPFASLSPEGPLPGLAGVGRGISSAERRVYRALTQLSPAELYVTPPSPQFLGFWGTLLLGSQNPHCPLKAS